MAIIEGFNHSASGQWLRVKQGVVTIGPGTIKRWHCSDNEEEKLEQLGDDTYQRRNILIYYCVFMIPIPIIYIPRIY